MLSLIQIRLITLADVMHRSVAVQVAGIDLPEAIRSGFSAPYPGLFDAQTECVLNHITVNDIEFRSGSEDARVTLRHAPWTPDSAVFNFDTSQVDVRIVMDAPYISTEQLAANASTASLADQWVNLKIVLSAVVRQPVLDGSTIRIAIEPESIVLAVDRLTVPRGLSPSIDEVIDVLNSPAILGALSVDPISINLSGLADVGELLLRNTAAKITADSLLIALEFQPPTTDELESSGYRPGTIPSMEEVNTAWRAFFDSESERSPANATVVVAKDLLARNVESTIQRQVEGEPELRFDGGGLPRSDWNVPPLAEDGGPCNPDGQAGMLTRFEITAIDACPPFDIDIDADIDLDISFALSRRGALRVELRQDMSISRWDSFRCGLANSHLAAFAGLTIGGVVGGWIGAAIGAAVLGVAAGIGTVALVLGQDAPSLESGSISPIDGEEDAYFTEVEIPLPSGGPLGGMRVVDLTPCNDGLLMNLTLTPVALLQGLLLDLAGPVPEFFTYIQEEAGFRPTGPGLAFPDYEVQTRLDLSIGHDPRNVPVTIYDAAILAPASMIAEDIQVLAVGRGRGVRLSIVAEESAARRLIAGADRNTIQLRLLTNAGARYLALPAIASSITLADLDRERADEEGRRDRIRDFDRRFRDRFEDIGLAISRIPQPPPRVPVPPLPEPPAVDPLPSVIRWSIVASRLPARAVLEVAALTQNGEPKKLHTARLVADDQAMFDAWEASNSATSQLAVRIRDAGKKSDTQLRVLGAWYEPVAEVVLPTDCESIALESIQRTPLLVLHRAKSKETLDLTIPGMPISARISGNRSVVKDQVAVGRNRKPVEAASRAQVFAGDRDDIDVMEDGDLAVTINHRDGRVGIYQLASDAFGHR
jgi:enamine deaminase RidA (YjgF/YER057c/UK114 family)